MRVLVGATWLFGLYLIATGQGDPIAHAVQHVINALTQQ